MLNKFQHHLREQFPYIENSRLLLACSGGLDSMVLADLLLKGHFNFSVAHCNYKLRGEDSDKDEELVQSWCVAKGIAIFTKTFDLSEVLGSIQLKARELRYGWFQILLEEKEYDYVLTAHHADDNMETFFINLSRGTGLDGLTGIPHKNQKIIRPLLPFSKNEILEYAKANNVSWREDLSNHETKYLRNKMRIEVLPKLREINADFSGNFQKTQYFLSLDSQILGDYANELKGKLFKIKGDEIHISIEDLKSLHPLDGYLHLLFKSYGFTQWEDLKNLLTAQSGKEILSMTHRIIKDRENLILLEYSNSDDEIITISEETIEIKHPLHLTLEQVKKRDTSLETVAYVDKEKLNYPLKLRKWKIGDYFYPFGMRGKKKLSKFFKDEKFSAPEKENQWLLCSNDDIVWVVGRRLDDRFKVTKATKEMMKLTWII